LKKIDLVELFFWTVRRNEKDVVNLYNSLSDLMRLATSGDMLNFGFWDEKTNTPLEAQKNLCTVFGKFAQLESKQKIIDVGSGFASPAMEWSNDYFPIQITCVNINYDQLSDSRKITSNGKIGFVNATARILPFEDQSLDRVLALESAQHFKPLGDFISESYRILKKDGMLVLAIPVVQRPTSIMKLGVLSMTWSSEHYSVDFVKSLLEQHGFGVMSLQRIGSGVYEPLANYYMENRKFLAEKILVQYPKYVEKILHLSLQKMKSLSEQKIIDYLLISCKKI
jgi:ubiquinone/menaquinone biosynthesis C-methylase UbiE